MKSFITKKIGAIKEKVKNKAVAVVATFSFAVVGLALTAEPASAAPVTFTGTTLPFTVPDMLSTAVNFLVLYGEWVLLALGVIFAPVLYGLAMKLVRSVKKSSAS